jgi:hypothetical protein
MDFMPPEVRPKSKEALADEFARLAKTGWISDQESTYRIYFGAHYHSLSDRGHWIEVMASTTKKPETFNFDNSMEIARQVGLEGAPPPDYH